MLYELGIGYGFLLKLLDLFMGIYLVIALLKWYELCWYDIVDWLGFLSWFHSFLQKSFCHSGLMFEGEIMYHFENPRRVIETNIGALRSIHYSKAYLNEYRSIRKFKNQNVEERPWRLETSAKGY